MTNCDFGDIKFGRLTVRRPALNIRDMRLVFVKSAAYTTVKQNPTPNLEHTRIIILIIIIMANISVHGLHR